jgi:hypothetical protein
MHGHFFVGLKKYIVQKNGSNTWERLLKKSGIGEKEYETFTIYPDKELLALSFHASKILKKPYSEILENLGEFMAPDLIKRYKVLFNPEWKTLDLVKNCDNFIHRVIRIQNPGLNPPNLQCTCSSPDEVEITYSSPLKMCSFAKGLLKGIANYYEENILVTEKTCVLKDSPNCLISVKLLK